MLLYPQKKKKSYHKCKNVALSTPKKKKKKGQECERENFTLHQKSPFLDHDRMKFLEFSLRNPWAPSFGFGDMNAQLGPKISASFTCSMH